MKFSGSDPMEKIDDAHQMILEQKIETNLVYKHRLAIIEKSDKKLIGTLLIKGFKNQPYRFEIGFSFDKIYWNKGYASETVKLLINYFKNTQKATELIAYCAKENLASAKVLEKNGFQKVTNSEVNTNKSYRQANNAGNQAVVFSNSHLQLYTDSHLFLLPISP